MISNTRNHSSPPSKMANSIRGLVSDILTLGDLQIQLFKSDLRDGRSHLLQSTVLLAISITLLLASLPVALIALSYGIVAIYGLPLWSAFLISAAIGFVSGGLLLYLGSRRLSKTLSFFQRSSEELSRNVKWVRGVTHVNNNAKYSSRN